MSNYRPSQALKQLEGGIDSPCNLEPLQRDAKDNYLFFKAYDDREYPFFHKGIATQRLKFHKGDSTDKDIHCPIDYDSEFRSRYFALDSTPLTNNKTISLQMQGIYQPKGMILAHTDIKDIARHPVVEDDFAPLTYLRWLGVDVGVLNNHGVLENIDADSLPSATFHLYVFFGVADIFRMVSGECQKQLLAHPMLRQDKRLKTVKEYLNDTGFLIVVDSAIELPWTVMIAGKLYRVNIWVHDLAAIAGHKTLDSCAALCGIDMPYKDTISRDEKSDMIKVYLERPKVFDNYALGDLNLYQMYCNYHDLFKTIYTDLGLGKDFLPPKPSIGSTVNRLLTSALEDCTGEEVLQDYCRYSTSSLVKLAGDSTALLAKTDGGRCFNNQPTIVKYAGALLDIDIAGCYGKALAALSYTFGRPCLIGYPLDSEINDYITLRKFLKVFKHELIDGMWFVRVSTIDGYNFKYLQDLLLSWLPPKDISKIKTDADTYTTDAWWNDTNKGEAKIFTRECHNAVINSDLLEVIESSASKPQLKELLDNLYVVAGTMYLKSEQRSSYVNFERDAKNHKGRNTSTIKKIKGITTCIRKEQEYYGWYTVNLGDLLINKLLVERAKHPKNSPLNGLYKLIINTTYGVLVSPYFQTSNIVLAQNITAKARAMAYMMEKGLNGFQTITDGTVFDLNKVLYPANKRRPSLHNLVNVYAKKNGDVPSWKLAPLEYDVNDLQVGKIFSVVNLHLKKIFPNVKCLDTYQLEIKALADTVILHGSANYQMYKDGVALDKPKMRGYSKKDSVIPHEIEDEIIHAPTSFFDSLANNPNKVQQQRPAINTKVLKLQEWRKVYSVLSEILPGQTVEDLQFIRLCTLSQFKFQTLSQRKAWLKQFSKLRDKQGQAYEMYFINDDKTINYQLMLETIDEKISGGLNSFWDSTKTKEHCNQSRLGSEHPQHQVHVDLKQAIRNYHGANKLDEAGFISGS
jgi:hypothetical protein